MSENQQLDPDGVWRQAIPLPFYTRRWLGLFGGWRYDCLECGHSFATEQAYRDHYRSDHSEPSS